MCARQPAARDGRGRTCQGRMCVLFALILGTARGAPRRGADRGAAGLFSQIDRKGRARPGSAPATAPSPASCLPSLRVRRLRAGARSAQVGIRRQGGGPPPSGKGLGATGMSQETQLVTPTSKEPKVGVSHRRERQPWSEAHVD